MKRGVPRHPKVGHLCELLRVRVPMAVGYLELLWHFTAEFAPQGDIGRFEDQRIEAALHWSGAKGKLISAMVGAGWIDRHLESRLVVHDWCDHADDAVRKRLSRSGLSFVAIDGKVTGQRRTTADNGSLPEPEPEPSQSQSQSRVNAASVRLVLQKSGERWRSDETFRHFREAYEETGKSLIDSDWAESWFEWSHLDFEQQLAAVAGVRKRIEERIYDEPRFVPLPRNFLQKREWQRVIAPRLSEDDLIEREAERIAAL
jgi:hypothetical protein